MPRFLTRRYLALPVLGVLAVTGAACSRDPEARKAKHVQRADAYAADKKWAEAVIELRNAADLSPSDGTVKVKLADGLLALGSPGEALREYVRAADLLSSDVPAQLRAGNLLLLAGRFDDAKVRAEKALAVAPKNAEAQILLANALAGLKDFDGAIVEVEEAIKLDPGQGSAYSSLGAFEAGRGRYDAAERAFIKATELDGTTARPHLALANFYWLKQRWPDVERSLQRALSVEPDNLLVQRALASFSMQMNRPAQAEQHLKRILEVSGSAQASLALADFYAARKDSASARDILELLSKSRDGATAAAIRLAALDHEAGQPDAAYAGLDQVIARDQRNLEAMLAKGSLLYADRRYDEALKTAEATVQAHSTSAAALFLVARIQSARGQLETASQAYKGVLRLNPRATGAQIALSRLNLAAGRASESVGFAEDAIAGDPQNANARLSLISGLIAQGELARAEREIDLLQQQYPKSSAVLVQRGMLLGRKRDAPGARRAFDEALAIDPKSAPAVAGLLSLDLAGGGREAAMERATQLEQSPATSADVLLVVARAYASAGSLDGAERVLRRILQLDSGSLAAYAALGQLYVRQGRLDEALTEINAVAARDARSVAARTMAGMILQSQGKTADAKARYEDALRIDGTNPVAANNLAWMIAEEGGNLDVALQLAQSAKRGLPSSAEVSNTLGVIYYRKELLPPAVRELRAAVIGAPDRAGFHHDLGLALAKSGDRTGARTHLQKALQLQPDYPKANDVRAMLRTLETQ